MKSAAPRRQRPNRRLQILAATEKLLREQGLAATTTRAIAEAVPCSEGAIYVHFPNRLQLILTVFEEALPEMLLPLHALDEKVGESTPRANLLQAFRGLQAFHERVTPMLCSLFAEADLLAGFRESLASGNKGPHGGVSRIARYIQAEQKTGRIAASVDADTAAATLMSASFFNAFTRALLGRSLPALSPSRLIDSVLR
jgi:AcrR family transcriptional regulator